MKNDREFLDEMWKKISQIEYEEIQIKSAKIRHRKITVSNIIIFLSIVAAFVLLIVYKPSMIETYIIIPVLLVLAYLLDKFINRENRENREVVKTDIKSENESRGVKVI